MSSFKSSYFETILSETEKQELLNWWNNMQRLREEYIKNFDPSAPVLKSSYPGNQTKKYNRKIIGNKKPKLISINKQVDS